MAAKTDAQVIADHTHRNAAGCLIWSGATTKGYGKLGRHGVTWQAHRWVWTITRGPIPAGMVIDHLCRTPLCVEVNHLEVTTIQVNTLRGISSSAENAVKTHCKRGHEFTAENTGVSNGTSARPGRACLACKRLYPVAYRAGMTLDDYLAQAAA